MGKTIVDYNGMGIVINHKDYNSYIKELREYYDTYINDARGHGTTEENGLSIYNFEDDESTPTGSLERIEEEFKEFVQLINQLGDNTEKYKELLILKR